MTKVDVAITITRPSCSDGRKVIALRLLDRTSGIQFVDVEFEVADFMEALTGLSHVDGAGEVRGLENVGKVREKEDTVFKVPAALWEKVMEGPWEGRTQRGNHFLKSYSAKEGWHVGTYLGSQNATKEEGDTVSIRGLYYRFVTKEQS